MNNIVFMAEGYTFDNLVDEEPQSLGINANGIVFQNFEQVLLDVLKDEIESALALESLLEHDYVPVLEQPEHFNFPHDGLFRYFIFFRLLEFLDGNYNGL